MRYFIRLAYNGTAYKGWQVQPGEPTVQLEINKALSKLQNEAINCVGCGRTDAGVHATEFYAHFDTSKTLPNNSTFRINSLLPWDITIYDVFTVKAEAHTRYDAHERVYEYHMHFDRDPFLLTKSYRYHYHQPDLELMQAAAAMLLEFQDFAPLAKLEPDMPNATCYMTQSHWRIDEANKRWVYTVGANRFLRSMVRRIVGAMLTIGRGKMTLDEFRHALETQEDLKISMVAPPDGLYLTKVNYPYLNSEGQLHFKAN